MIGRRERLSYAVGDLGFNLIWQSIELYLFFFYVEVLQLPLGIAAAIFLIGAAVDWLVDPAIGALADRGAATRPLRLWVLISGPMVGVALWLAFLVPPFDMTGVAAYAAATHIALRFAYGCGNIPYAALTARMTDDPTAHVRLTGLRMQGAAVGGIIAALVYALAPAGESGTGSRFVFGAIILGILAQPCFLITWAGVRERVSAAPPGRAFSLIAELRAFFSLVALSATLRRVLATIVAAGLSTTVTVKSILFLFDRDLHAGPWGYWAALLPSIALLATTPLWVAMAGRIGRSSTLLAATLAHGAALVLLAAAQGRGIEVMTALLALAIAASCGMSVMFWSLVPAAIRDLERSPEVAGCAARVYALSTTSRKLGQALAPQIITLSLLFTGGGDASLKGGSVLPALVAAAALCVITVFLYRPLDSPLESMRNRRHLPDRPDSRP